MDESSAWFIAFKHFLVNRPGPIWSIISRTSLVLIGALIDSTIELMMWCDGTEAIKPLPRCGLELNKEQAINEVFSIKASIFLIHSKSVSQ